MISVWRHYKMNMCFLHAPKGNLYQSKPAQVWFFFTEILRYIRPGTQYLWWHIFPPGIALVFLLLAEHYLTHMSKEPIIRHSYQWCANPCMANKVESWWWWLIDFVWTGSKIVQQELIEVLCNDSTGCKEVGDNDFHRCRQWQTLNLSVT